uniref:Uncharacterized protein n=1 Tax=Castor canadensis TaxID=51338 RepID=A0A8C0VZB5_CASCN
MGDQAGLHMGKVKQGEERPTSGREPSAPPVTSPTGGCRAQDWVTPPAPRRTSSPATPQPRSSKRSARNSCGSPRNRARCRTSTADPPPCRFASIRFPWKQDPEEIN